MKVNFITICQFCGQELERLEHLEVSTNGIHLEPGQNEVISHSACPACLQNFLNQCEQQQTNRLTLQEKQP